MSQVKTVKLRIDGTDAISELKKVRGEVDSTYADLRRTTPIEIDGSKATKEIKKVGAEINRTADDALQIGDNAEESSEGFKILGVSVKGVGVALKGLGIGLLISAFLSLQRALSQNQEVMDSVNVVLETISITVQNIIGTIVDNGKKVVDFFQKVGSGITKFFKQDLDGLNSSYEENNEQTETALQRNRRLAKEIVNLRKEVKLAEAQQRQLQLTYQKEAELQRQVRDDVSLTIDERIKANAKLGEILEKQFQDEKALADKKVELAEKELANNETNVDLQVALINAQTELADLEERIVGQRSEQLINETALQNEFMEANKESVVTLKATGLEKVNVEDEIGKQMIAGRKKTQDALNDITKKGEELDLQTIKLSGEQKRAIVANTMGQLASVFGQESKAGKALAIGQTLISTYSAAAAALKSPPEGAGPIWGIPIAAGAVISGMQNVAKIKATKLPYGGDGGGGSTPAPAVPSGIGGSGLIPNLENIQSAPLTADTPPVQAFVVENDISNAQALQQELDTQATL